MMDIHARQTSRQSCAFGLLAGLDRGFCSRGQLLEFKLDGGNVSLDGFFDQTDLSSIELLTAAPELPAFEGCQFMGEFVDLGLAVLDVAVFGCDDLALLGQLGNEFLSELTQLFCVQIRQ